MAHAIGCLGSATETYRREKVAAKARANTPHARVRNQTRKTTLVMVSHDNGRTFRGVHSKAGHLHHVKKAYLFASDFTEYKR